MDITVILPTIGRVVWYRGQRAPILDDGQARAAIVAFVHSPSVVNLAVFGHDGAMYPVQSVQLVQAHEPQPDEGAEWCQWMPYQRVMAATGDASLANQLAQKEASAAPGG